MGQCYITLEALLDSTHAAPGPGSHADGKRTLTLDIRAFAPVAVPSRGSIGAAPIALPTIAKLIKAAKKYFLILPEIRLYGAMDILKSFLRNVLRLCMQ